MRRSLRLLRSFLLLVAAGWLFCLLLTLVWSLRQDDANADVIVVLGAAHYGGRPSPVLRARLDHALQLYRDKRAPVVMLTGGRHPGDSETEAAVGRRYMLERGVPDSAVMMEVEGRTTLASMRAAAAVIHSDKRGGDVPNPRVLLVSDPFHMLRLDILARINSLKPQPAPTTTSPISANRVLALEYAVRESFAVPADILLSLWMSVGPEAGTKPTGEH